MKAPWNFARFLPLAGRLLARGRLPTLLFAVASKGAAQGNRLGKLKDDLPGAVPGLLARRVSGHQWQGTGFGGGGFDVLPQPGGCDSGFHPCVRHA